MKIIQNVGQTILKEMLLFDVTFIFNMFKKLVVFNVQIKNEDANIIETGS